MDTPHLAVTTPTLETSVAAATPIAELCAAEGDVKEPVVVLDLESTEDKGSVTALSVAETASRSSIDCTTDVAPVVEGAQQTTTTCAVVTKAPSIPTATTTTSTPTSQHSNGNAHASESSNTNGNNNSYPPANTCTNSGNTKRLTPTDFAKAVNHQSIGRNNYNKAKVTLKMRFKVAKRICQRRVRAKNIDENFPQPQ